jgi:hypothetical protein
VVGLRLESEPGARSGMTPTSGARLAARERRERGVGWAVGPGKEGEAGWAARGEKRKKEKAG